MAHNASRRRRSEVPTDDDGPDPADWLEMTVTCSDASGAPQPPLLQHPSASAADSNSSTSTQRAMVCKKCWRAYLIMPEYADSEAHRRAHVCHVEPQRSVQHVFYACLHEGRCCDNCNGFVKPQWCKAELCAVATKNSEICCKCDRIRKGCWRCSWCGHVNSPVNLKSDGSNRSASMPVFCARCQRNSTDGDHHHENEFRAMLAQATSEQIAVAEEARRHFCRFRVITCMSGAGSGKTTTAKLLALYFIDVKRMPALYLTYNKATQRELAQYSLRSSARSLSSRTLDSLCWRIAHGSGAGGAAALKDQNNAKTFDRDADTLNLYNLFLDGEETAKLWNSLVRGLEGVKVRSGAPPAYREHPAESQNQPSTNRQNNAAKNTFNEKKERKKLCSPLDVIFLILAKFCKSKNLLVADVRQQEVGGAAAAQPDLDNQDITDLSWHCAAKKGWASKSGNRWGLSSVCTVCSRHGELTALARHTFEWAWQQKILVPEQMKFTLLEKVAHLLLVTSRDMAMDRLTCATPRILARHMPIILDEAQDSNACNMDTIMRIAEANASAVFIIGDAMQSIYAFRGSNLQCFRDVGQQQRRTIAAADGGDDAPELRRHMLTKSFRFREPIAEAANVVSYCKKHSNKNVDGLDTYVRLRGKDSDESLQARLDRKLTFEEPQLVSFDRFFTKGYIPRAAQPSGVGTKYTLLARRTATLVRIAIELTQAPLWPAGKSDNDGRQLYRVPRVVMGNHHVIVSHIRAVIYFAECYPDDSSTAGDAQAQSRQQQYLNRLSAQDARTVRRLVKCFGSFDALVQEAKDKYEAEVLMPTGDDGAADATDHGPNDDDNQNPMEEESEMMIRQYGQIAMAIDSYRRQKKEEADAAAEAAAKTAEVAAKAAEVAAEAAAATAENKEDAVGEEDGGVHDGEDNSVSRTGSAAAAAAAAAATAAATAAAAATSFDNVLLGILEAFGKNVSEPPPHAKADTAEYDVWLSVVHQAKGAEWPVVVLARNDFLSLTPGAYNQQSKQYKFEFKCPTDELHILYVAMTRPMGHLVLPSALYFWSKFLSTHPSFFNEFSPTAPPAPADDDDDDGDVSRAAARPAGSREIIDVDAAAPSRSRAVSVLSIDDSESKTGSTAIDIDAESNSNSSALTLDSAESTRLGPPVAPTLGGLPPLSLSQQQRQHLQHSTQQPRHSTTTTTTAATAIGSARNQQQQQQQQQQQHALALRPGGSSVSSASASCHKPRHICCCNLSRKTLWKLTNTSNSRSGNDNNSDLDASCNPSQQSLNSSSAQQQQQQQQQQYLSVVRQATTVGDYSPPDAAAVSQEVQQQSKHSELAPHCLRRRVSFSEEEIRDGYERWSRRSRAMLRGDNEIVNRVISFAARDATHAVTLATRVQEPWSVFTLERIATTHWFDSEELCMVPPPAERPKRAPKAPKQSSQSSRNPCDGDAETTSAVGTDGADVPPAATTAAPAASGGGGNSDDVAVADANDDDDDDDGLCVEEAVEAAWSYIRNDLTCSAFKGDGRKDCRVCRTGVPCKQSRIASSRSMLQAIVLARAENLRQRCDAAACAKFGRKEGPVPHAIDKLNQLHACWFNEYVNDDKKRRDEASFRMSIGPLGLSSF